MIPWGMADHMQRWLFGLVSVWRDWISYCYDSGCFLYRQVCRTAGSDRAWAKGSYAVLL